MYVLKSRGMAHSNQIREFRLTERGIDLLDVYIGPEGVLTGSLRASQEAREKAAALQQKQDTQRKQRELNRKRKALEAQILALRSESEVLEEEAKLIASQEQERDSELARCQADMAHRRGVNTSGTTPPAHRGTRKGERT
jgi:circadian clock protein KaiC